MAFAITGEMKKIAIVTDSNSGMTQKQGAELGVFVLPMPFSINDETFFEDITLSTDEFYDKMKDNATIVTSQPSPEEVTQLWKKILKDYESIVHIPMSSALSGSCQTAIMLAEEFGGSVQVVNNQRISLTQRQSVLDARVLASKGKSSLEIKQYLEDDKYNSSIYIMLDTLYYLKKGGRITPAAATLGTILKLKPVLQIQGEKLDAFAKARTSAQGKSIMISAIKKDMQKRFNAVTGSEVYIHIAHSHNLEAALILKEELQQLYPQNEIYVDELSLSVACHIGPGSLAIACTKKLNC